MTEIVKQNNQTELVKQLGLTKVAPQEIEHFFAVAKQLKLDPLSKQIYAILYGNKLTIMVSIDGARAIACRSEDYAGIDVPDYEVSEHGKPISCSVTVYRIVQGIRCGFSHKAFFNEYNTGQNLWAKKPLTMIAKVAEMGALRKAFPADFNKVYEPAEFDSQPRFSDAEVVETLTGEQQQVLHGLTMLAKPSQDADTAWNRVGKLAQDDFADYALHGIESLLKNEVISEDDANGLRDHLAKNNLTQIINILGK